MIDCHGRLVTSSRLLWTVEQERKRKIHEKRLETINKRRPRNKRKNKKKKPKGLQSGIDNYIEKGNYQHILDNKKGKYMKEREKLEVKRINKLLLGQLQKVFASDSPFDEIEPEFVKPRSLNINSRRKELIRINMENRSMLRRLESVEPTMSARRLADEDKIRRKDRKRLQNFIPTVDIYVHSQSIANKSSRSMKKDWDSGSTSTTSSIMPVPPKRKTTRPRRNKPKTKGRKITESVLSTATAPPQPEDQEEKEVAVIHVPCCLQSHPLELVQVDSKQSYNCDGCSRDVSEALHCHICNWGLCTQCAGAKPLQFTQIEDNNNVYKDDFEDMTEKNAKKEASTTSTSVLKDEAITQFIAFVAKNAQATTITYKQLIKGIALNEDVRIAWSKVTGSVPMTATQCAATLFNKQAIDSNDLLRWVVATDNETTKEGQENSNIR